jgi:hypothetical protein
VGESGNSVEGLQLTSELCFWLHYFSLLGS